MLNPVAKKWVEALRSGKYKQGTGELVDYDMHYCCLGVLCELAVEVEIISRFNYAGGLYLPSPVQEWAGLSGDTGKRKAGDSLSALNDSGKSFAEIADLIESEPEGLFA